MSREANCVGEHKRDPDRPRRAADGLWLCLSCRDGLAKDLLALPRLWHDLGTGMATASGPAGYGGGFVTGSPSAPLPINTAFSDHRDQIRHDLVWWCRFVAEERGIGLPGNSVSEVAVWLGRHVDWIAAHHVAAEECPPVMRGLTGRAHGLLEPSGARRIEIGACRDSVDGERCTGTLWATVRREDDVRPSVIYCDGCGSERGAEEWRRFGRDYLRQAAS